MQLRFVNFLKSKKMEINFQKISYEIKPDSGYITSEGERIGPEFFASVSVTFTDDQGRNCTLNGFSIRRKGRGRRLYLVGPWKRVYEYGEWGFVSYFEIDQSLWEIMEKEIIAQYEREYPGKSVDGRAV